MNIYQENIMDHFRHPRNKGVLAAPTVQHEEYNPVCGDKIIMTAKLDDDIVIEVKFDGVGCAISQAAASMLTEVITGKAADDVVRMSKEEMLSMLGIPVGPVRMKCALLALRTIQKALVWRKNNVRN